MPARALGIRRAHAGLLSRSTVYPWFEEIQHRLDCHTPVCTSSNMQSDHFERRQEATAPFARGIGPASPANAARGIALRQRYVEPFMQCEKVAP